MISENPMRKPWLPAALVLLGMTSACAGGPRPVATAAATPAASTPAPVAGYDWFLTADAHAARLAYGVETSDELKLGLDCDAGAGKVVLTAHGPTGAREIHLESGGETERFAADGEPAETHEGDLLTATADTDEPVLQRFRRLGWIAQWIGDQREAYAPHPGSEAGVERFFALCG